MPSRACFTALLTLPLAACFAQTAQPGSHPGASAPTGTVQVVPVAPAATPASVPAPQPVPASQPKVTYSQCSVEGPSVAITFDDGPSPENTPRLLDMLKKRGLKATFFVVGQCAVEYPDIMKRIAAEGHEIGNHSWSHPLLTKLGEGAVTEQLQRTHDAIQQTAGVTAKVMRPPYGGFTANQRVWAHKKWGYKTILWDVDPLDWKVRNAGHVESEILKRTVNGSIILAHDIHKSTVDAMPGTLDGLLAKGHKFVTVSELLAMDRPTAPRPKPAPVEKAAAAAAVPAPGATPAAVATPAAIPAR